MPSSRPTRSKLSKETMCAEQERARAEHERALRKEQAKRARDEAMATPNTVPISSTKVRVWICSVPIFQTDWSRYRRRSSPRS